MKTTQVVYELVNQGFVQVNAPKNPLKANFVIVCQYGDWSGFRTLAECQSQFDELLENQKPNGFYWVEER